MHNIFKFILVFIFLLSSFVAANDKIIIIKWECINCHRKFIGEKPPQFKKCIKFPHTFDIWILKSINTFEKLDEV